MTLLEIHKSKSKVAEILGWPLNMVNTLTADVVALRGLTLEQYAEFVHQHKAIFCGGIFNLDVIDSGEKSYETGSSCAALVLIACRSIISATTLNT